MKLSLAQIAAWLPGATLVGDGGQSVQRVHTDTRSLQAGDLFVALKGERFDAADFIASAAQQGASAVLCNADAADQLAHDRVVLRDADLRGEGVVAGEIHGHVVGEEHRTAGEDLNPVQPDLAQGRQPREAEDLRAAARQPQNSHPRHLVPRNPRRHARGQARGQRQGTAGPHL